MIITKHILKIYYIRSRCNGRYVNVTTGTAHNGSNVALALYTGAPAQKWYIRNLGDGTYTITSAINTNYSLDFHGGLDQNESYLNLWNGPNNRFRIQYHSSSRGKYVVISPAFSNPGFTSDSFASGFVSGMHANGRFIEYP